jgi:hypothetical protein
MLRELILICLALGTAALVTYGCNSTSSQSSETSSEVNTPPPSKSQKESESQERQKVSGRAIWKGNSGGFAIEWTTHDLFSRSGERVERIFQQLARRGYDEFVADINTDDQMRGRANCDYRRSFKLLSIVGSLITFQDDEYKDCGGAHPTTEMRFTAIDIRRQGEVFYGQGENSMDADLARPGKLVKLTDYFRELDILKALLADRIIKQALADAAVESSPQTLAALPQIFAKDDYVLTETELALRPDFLTRFAFHHVEDDTVAVRLHLPSIAFAYRSRQIGLLLPITIALRQPLALAATRREGFLMKEAPPGIRNQFTRFAFKIGKGSPNAVTTERNQ